jgi:hypothetical protein
MAESVSHRSKDFVSELIEYGPGRTQSIYAAAEKLDEMCAEIESTTRKSALAAVETRVHALLNSGADENTVFRVLAILGELGETQP